MDYPSGPPAQVRQRFSIGVLPAAGMALLGLLAGLIMVMLLFVQRTGRVQLLAYQGTPLDEPAAEFQLVDQAGELVSLAELRGQVVALTFLDSQCQETCPLTATQLRAAHQALGEDADAVTFLGINVNVEANMVADVAATTRRWRLDEIPSWRFLTGSAEALAPVWQAYAVAVMRADEEEGALSHTPGVYLIDQAGYKRWYVSIPMSEPEGSLDFPPLSDLLVLHIQGLLSR